MAEFGALLKQAREDRGMTLRQIATTTKISMVALEALERDDFSRLPGGIFAARSFARMPLEVGLEPDQHGRDVHRGIRPGRQHAGRRTKRPEITPTIGHSWSVSAALRRILRVVLIALVLVVAGALVLLAGARQLPSWAKRGSLSG